MKMVIVMRPHSYAPVRPRIIKQDFFHERVREEEGDQSSCRFLVVRIIVPSHGELAAIFAQRAHINLEAVHMRRMFVFRAVGQAYIADPKFATINGCCGLICPDTSIGGKSTI